MLIKYIWFRILVWFLTTLTNVQVSVASRISAMQNNVPYKKAKEAYLAQVNGIAQNEVAKEKRTVQVLQDFIEKDIVPEDSNLCIVALVPKRFDTVPVIVSGYVGTPDKASLVMASIDRSWHVAFSSTIHELRETIIKKNAEKKTDGQRTTV